jgi:hypothetical protein
VYGKALPRVIVLAASGGCIVLALTAVVVCALSAYARFSTVPTVAAFFMGVIALCASPRVRSQHSPDWPRHTVLRKALRAVSFRWIIALCVVLAACVVIRKAISGDLGTPLLIPDNEVAPRYLLNNHGVFTEIPRQQYRLIGLLLQCEASLVCLVLGFLALRFSFGNSAPPSGD